MREDRNLDLSLLTWAVSQNREEVERNNPEIKDAIEGAIMGKTYSKMEKMERLLKRTREDEEFMKLAAEILFNG